MPLNDQIVDDDEPDTCPLCIEELDLSDRGFRPCPCGYQICQFCYNNIKTTMNGLCPACRRIYDDKNIKFDAPSAEEVARFKENRVHADKKRQAAKRQEAASRQADTLSRKHLAGIRVRRQNLVYVTGLRLNTSDPTLSDKLRGDQFFGQYGKIDKIVVNRPKDSRALQPVGVYITYFDKEAAALCIDMVNNSQNAGGTIRADYGTTKYCSAFLRHETCTNKNCTFLHEVGDDNESFTREGLSSLNAFSSQANQDSSSPANEPVEQQPPQPHHFPAISESLERAEHKAATHSTDDIPPPPGLPATAAWGRPGASSNQVSQTPTPAAASPATTAAVPATNAVHAAPVPSENPPAPEPSHAPYHEITPLRPIKSSFNVDIRSIRKLLATTDITFDADYSHFSEEQQKFFRLCPPLWDPDDGLSRYAAQQREAEQRRLEKDQEVATRALAGMHTEEAPESGSLQLGGEPEDRQDLNARRQNLAIQPPSDIMSPTFSSISHVLSPQAQTPGLGGRGSAPQHQFMPHQYKSPSPGFPQQNQSSQASMYNNTHQRQSSRFDFGNDGIGSKAATNSKFMNQNTAMGPPSSSYGSQYFPSGVQGPPPGLKATGTPPVSGGGMFGQGHGFATAGLGYGVNSTNRSANDDLLRDLLRNRGGSAGSGQTSEAGRREYKFPSSTHQYPSSSRSSGLSSFPYGSTPGAFQDHGPQKQKKKGKKHRHANTSSSGGGVVDLADPSILQSRMHQGGTGHQGHYGAQGQGQGGFNSIYGNGGYGGRW